MKSVWPKSHATISCFFKVLGEFSWPIHLMHSQLGKKLLVEEEVEADSGRHLELGGERIVEQTLGKGWTSVTAAGNGCQSHLLLQLQLVGSVEQLEQSTVEL